MSSNILHSAPQGWCTPEGLSFLKTLLTRLVPWPTGPHDWQIASTARILDGADQLVVAGCGEGKTALAYLHILVLQELIRDAHLPRFGLKHIPEKPVTLMASPLTDLALSQVSVKLYQYYLLLITIGGGNVTRRNTGCIT